VDGTDYEGERQSGGLIGFPIGIFGKNIDSIGPEILMIGVVLSLKRERQGRRTHVRESSTYRSLSPLPQPTKTQVVLKSPFAKRD
jgi:hypothetical protein